MSVGIGDQLGAGKPQKGKKRCNEKVIKSGFFPREAQSLWLSYPALSLSLSLTVSLFVLLLFLRTKAISSRMTLQENGGGT